MRQARRYRALGGASLIALAILGSPARSLAQDATVPEEEGAALEAVTAEQPADPADPAADEGAIVVTGTRIRRPDLQFANPITSFDDRSIVLSGRTNLTDFLTQTPALIGSADSNDNAGSNAGIGFTGLNLLDLRNLGSNRTLVLIDGRRHVAAVPGSAAIDVNTIPTDLVERIDVVTGGASAIYGADGVSGVVNFVLKRDFEGITARGQAGISSHGDAGNRFFSITAGENFGGDRGNVAISYEYNKDDRLKAFDRARNRPGTQVTFQLNPDDGTGRDDDPAVPDNIPLDDIRFFDSARGGAVDVDFDGLPDFEHDGSPFDPGRFVPDFFQQGGSGTPTADYIGDLLPSIERHAVNGLFRYALTDSLNVFAQGKYVRTKSFSISQPTFDFYIFIPEDNPLIPQAVRDRIIPGIGEEVFGPGAPDGILLNRDNFDFGSRGEDIKRETIRGVFGLDGEISDRARFEVSYVYGQSKAVNRRSGNRFNDRFFAAVDVVRAPDGTLTCRSNLDPDAEPFQLLSSSIFPGFISFTPGPASGCVPLDLFGEGAPSQAALDFVTVTSTDTSKITQHVASGSISGDLGEWFSLPGGDVGFAVGAEWRRETSRSTPAPEDTSGATFGNIVFPSRGAFEVREVFAEVNLPILKDVPFAHNLSVGAAIRLSDYTTIGTTTTFKVDGVYSPIRDVTFRATYAQAVRAPNIGELFDPASQTFEFITDPCDANQQRNGESVRPANCAALLAAAGFSGDPADFNDTNSASIAGFSNGNPDLSEETAKTYTAGVVLQPRFLPGFSLAIDGYDITLKDAINQVAAQELAELCVDQASIDNIFCDAIDRQQGGAQAGRISGFVLQPENVANFRTRGVDFTANYRFAPGDLGIFNARLVGGYLDKLSFIGSPGAEPTISRNQPFAPKWVVNFDLTYTRGPLTANYGISYFSKTNRFTEQEIEAQPDIAEPRFIQFKEKWEHDLQLSYDIGERFSIYGGVNNLFDEKPALGATFFPVSAVGRYFYVGARASLDNIF